MIRKRLLFDDEVCFVLDQFLHWALVLHPKTSKTLFGPVKFFSFYLELIQEFNSDQ
jgi:hypothetical protein